MLHLGLLLDIVALLKCDELLVEATREVCDVAFDTNCECMAFEPFLPELFVRQIDAPLEFDQVLSQHLGAGFQLRGAICDGIVHQRPPFTAQRAQR